jgi:cytochrome P450
MNYVPSQAARDTHTYFIMSERKLVERQVAEEAAQASGKEVRRDIFHYLIRSRDPETGLGFTHAQLQADAGLLIAAGSDGVGLTVAAAVFYLLHNPLVLDKLIREIRSSFSSLDQIRNPKLNQLSYLQAVVHEALRLAPSVPSAFPREVLEGGLVVDALHIPKGMTVGVSAYAVHHNELYFPDSFDFRPERWLTNDERESAARSAFCTFGGGPYNCIGKNVAILAIKLVLAKMLYAYDIRAAEGRITGGGSKELGHGREKKDEFQMLDYLVGYRSGPMVQLKAKDGGQ